jgi:hypothetical protein
MRLAAPLAAALAFAAVPPAAAAEDPSSTPPAAANLGPGAAAARPSTPKVPADPEARPVPAASVLEEITGTVSAVDRSGWKLEIATAKGPVTLHLDRNTLVYTQTGLGTVLDLSPGQPIRAGRNATFTAYWVQLRPAAAGAPPPGPGAAAPAEGNAERNKVPTSAQPGKPRP